MKKVNDKGFSFVEIMIALVIFTILLIPIISQLMTSMRVSREAKQKQYATDYSESVIEYFKQREMKETFTATDVATIQNGIALQEAPSVVTSRYAINSSGAEDTAIKTYEDLAAYNKSCAVGNEKALVNAYTFSGKTKLSDGNLYDVSVKLTTEPFAKASFAGNTDQNAVNLGNLSNLDSNREAVITNASNFDTPASNSFYNEKISAMERDPALVSRAEQIRNGQLSFIKDTVVKNTTIKIEKLVSGSKKTYTVSCILDYTDSDATFNVLTTDKKKLSYVAYQQTFTDKIPNIYLMYNQCLYNGKYTTDDITFVNTTGEKAKYYIVRTAETNANIKDTLNTGDQSLVAGSSTGYGRDAKNASGAYLARTIFHVSNLTSNPIEVYTNMDISSMNGTNDKIQLVFSGASGNVLKSLANDERYASVGRIYDVTVTLTNTATGKKTVMNSSKGGN